MSSNDVTVSPGASTPSAGEKSSTGGRRFALAVIAGAQFMVVLDGTIMNIALPSIQSSFDMSPLMLSWVVNAYALAFGGLLLLGGRMGDVLGRLSVFKTGLLIFAAASLLGGVAPGQELLIAARVLQGVGAAIVAPTALALIATSFQGVARGKAMGVYGAMGGLGSTAGLLAGGVLTSYLSWRWVLFVNIPIALLLVYGARFVNPGARNRQSLNVPSAIAGTLGAASLVYAITRSGEYGLSNSLTLMLFGLALVSLVGFFVTQSKVRNPLLPLSILSNRTRAGSNAGMLLVGVGMFATYYFLTLYMQQVLGYSAVEAALAYLPWALGILVASGVIAPRLLPSTSPVVIAGVGLLVTAVGMLWLSRLDTNSSYVTSIGPAMLVAALGLGSTFVPLTICAMGGVEDQNTGAAAAVMNTGQQVGGAVGLAALAGWVVSVSDRTLPQASEAVLRANATGDGSLLSQAQTALTDGYTSAFLAIAGVYVLAFFVVVLMVRPQTQGQVPAKD